MVALSTLLVALGLAAACGPAETGGATGSGGEARPSAAAPERPTDPTTVLVAREPAADAGTVWEGTVLEQAFVFEVEREATAVHAVSADCGCTVAELHAAPPDSEELRPYEEGAVLAPGSRLVARVTYDTAGKRGRTPRTVSLYATQGAVRVTLTADVRPYLTLAPERIELGTIGEREERVVTLDVASTDGTPFALRHLERGVPPEVRVATRPAEGAADAEGRAPRWKAEVRFGPGLPRGPHAYPIQLETDVPLPDGSLRGATPYATVTVVGPVALDPPTLSFGTVEPGSLVARTTRLVSHDGRPLGRPEAHYEPLREEYAGVAERATVSVRAVAGAWEIQVLLSGADEVHRGTFLGRLVVETDHPEEPRLEAPVSGAVLPPAPGAVPAPSDPRSPGRGAGLPPG